MLDKNKPHIKLNLNRELCFKYNYSILNNILYLDIPIKNSNKTITVNFEIIDILGSNGFDIKKVFVSNIKNDKANLLQFRNKKK